MGLSPLLTVGEITERFGVDRDTLTAWERRGLITAARTLTRRYYEDDVRNAAQAVAQEEELKRTEHERAEQLRRLTEFAQWVISLDRPDRAHERQRVTLNRIIQLAHEALGDVE